MRKPCCDKQEMNRGAWSKQEDQKLIEYIQKHGGGKWRSLPRAAGLLRCGKSCRLRWINYLRPDLKRGNFAEDEEDLIIKLHALLGNRWSLIAGRLPGRTDNEVKNYWNSHLRKKLLDMGVNPDNHRIHQHLIIPPQSIKTIPEQFDQLPCAATSAPAEKTSYPEQDDHQLSCAIISSSSVDKTSEEIPDLSLNLAVSNIPGDEMTTNPSSMMQRRIITQAIPLQHFFSSNDWKLGL